MTKFPHSHYTDKYSASCFIIDSNTTFLDSLNIFYRWYFMSNIDSCKYLGTLLIEFCLWKVFRYKSISKNTQLCVLGSEIQWVSLISWIFIFAFSMCWAPCSGLNCRVWECISAFLSWKVNLILTQKTVSHEDVWPQL